MGSDKNRKFDVNKGKVCYTSIRRNVIYGTKTQKKQKMDIMGGLGDIVGGGGGGGVFGVG